MRNHVMEIVTFRLAKGISEEQFAGASGAFTAFGRKQKGFVARRLSLAEDGTWTDNVEWESMEDAQAAMAAFPQDKSLAPVMAMIDAESVNMSHQALMDAG